MKHPATSGYEGGFTLVELMVVVSILGILSAVAVPALDKYVRRSKTSEARVNIAKMYDGNVAFFQTHAETVARGSVRLLSQGGRVTGTMAQCPPPEWTDGLDYGRTGGYGGMMWGTRMVPDVRCADFPNGKCIPASSYPMEVWEKSPFPELGFRMDGAHYYRYSFKATNWFQGHGHCKFTTQAFGDLDDDDVMSTFERAGSCDSIGCNSAAGLYVNLEME